MNYVLIDAIIMAVANASPSTRRRIFKTQVYGDEKISLEDQEYISNLKLDKEEWYLVTNELSKYINYGRTTVRLNISPQTFEKIKIFYIKKNKIT